MSAVPENDTPHDESSARDASGTVHPSIELADRYGARNYHPLPVSLVRGAGVWVWDTEGRKYLDMLSSYSALNQGHRHSRILTALEEQCKKITLTSRAFHNDQLGNFLRRLSEATGFARALPMNTGAEAVETAIKAARKWGYQHKGVPAGKAEIIVCTNNFHGRTTTIVGFSSEEQYRAGFGPFTPGFVEIPFGDAAALEAAVNSNTVGFLVEPIQGEGGIIVPPDGYLASARKICDDHNVLLLVDEIQTGLGRTGTLFAYEYDNIRPDVLILGKALGGGVYPVSAICAQEEVMGVFQPGDHGSTFGGNPVGACVGTAALAVILEEDLPHRARSLGDWFRTQLEGVEADCILEVRGRGLLLGVEIKAEHGPARPYCEALMERGILAKETHQQVIRFAPPLVIDQADLEWAFEQVRDVLLGVPAPTAEAAEPS